jgi:hypothetical protein
MTRPALFTLIVLAAVVSLAGCLGGGSDRVGGAGPADVRTLTLLDPFSSGSDVAEFKQRGCAVVTRGPAHPSREGH